MTGTTTATEWSEFYAPGLMDLSPYRLAAIEPGPEWDTHVDASVQGSLFCRSAFLRPLNAQPSLWLVYKRDTVQAALALLENETGDSLIEHDMVIHNGLMFSPPEPNQNRAQILSEQFRISCFVVSEITDRYAVIHLSTHPAFDDLRPFLWHNYGEPGPKFALDLRYTSIIELSPEDGSGEISTSPLYTGANKSRRQEIRYGLKNGLVVEEAFAPERFLGIYAETFSRQGLPPGQDLDELDRLLHSLKAEGLLRMFLCRDAAGHVGSVAVFGLDNQRAYYLFGANDPDFRDSHMGTFVLWQALRTLAGDGVRTVDLEGVNSPARGYFKLSFGGNLMSYHQVSLVP